MARPDAATFSREIARQALRTRDQEAAALARGGVPDQMAMGIAQGKAKEFIDKAVGKRKEEAGTLNMRRGVAPTQPGMNADDFGEVTSADWSGPLDKPLIQRPGQAQRRATTIAGPQRGQVLQGTGGDGSASYADQAALAALGYDINGPEQIVDLRGTGYGAGQPGWTNSSPGNTMRGGVGQAPAQQPRSRSPFAGQPAQRSGEIFVNGRSQNAADISALEAIRRTMGA